MHVEVGEGKRGLASLFGHHKIMERKGSGDGRGHARGYIGSIASIPRLGLSNMQVVHEDRFCVCEYMAHEVA